MDGGVKYNTFTGVPQGGIVSPILSNIYLHEFDSYVLSLIDKYSSKGRLISKVNPAIVKYSNQLSLLNDEYQVNKCVETLTRIKTLRAERNTIPSRIRTGTRV